MRHRQRGLSLIELLIAMGLSIGVIYAAVSLFMANRGTASTTQGIAALSDSGRVGLTFIGESARSGGYMACNGTNSIKGMIYANGTTRQISILEPGASPVLDDYTEAFGGYEANGTGPMDTPDAAAVSDTPVADGDVNDWAGGLDALLAGQVVQGTDVLVVRESLQNSAPVYTSSQYTTGAGQVLVPVYSVGDLAPGQYAVISNCTVSTAFQIGVVDAVGKTIGTAGPLDLFGGDLQWSYEFPSSITPVDMAIYFIGVGRDTDASLFVYHESTGLFQELVPDVENMQILYGVAAAAPNTVTQYVTADKVIDFNQVVSIKVALLVASPPGAAAVATPAVAPTYTLLGTTVTAPIDTRLRKVFDTTIAVRSAVL